jgi:hypothetical protein
LKEILFESFFPVGLIAIVRLYKIVFPVCLLVLCACAKSHVETSPARPSPGKPPVKTSPAELPDKTVPVPPPAKSSPAEPPAAKPPSVKSSPVKAYSETISGWKSYQDLVRWMEKDFSFDANRFKKFEGTLPPPRTPEETFNLKSGIYFDAALFAKETLNRINPAYQAKIAILIIRPYGANHYFCSFQSGGKIITMDYGTPYKETTGTRGPYSSLEEVKKFYEKYFPVKGRIEAITYLP